MSLRNIRSCSCQHLRSIIRRENFINTRQHSICTPNSSFVNQSSRSIRSISVAGSVAGSLTGAHVHNNHRYYTSQGTVSTKELEKFKTLVPEWWKNDGEYIALHSLNKLRVALIKEVLGRNEKIPHHPVVNPLSGFKILDVGCGGGILAEPLARLGADVVGIDPLHENIEAAKAHIKDNEEFEKLTYECATVEDVSAREEYFDLVVASEVLEHVENTNTFVRDCCRAVKPGGRLVVTTINRTLLSTLLVKYAAEYLLRIVPRDTHDEGKFITPDEVVDMLRESGMVGMNFRGMFMNPVTYRWSWTDSLSMNYACYATKPL